MFIFYTKVKTRKNIYKNKSVFIFAFFILPGRSRAVTPSPSFRDFSSFPLPYFSPPPFHGFSSPASVYASHARVYPALSTCAAGAAWREIKIDQCRYQPRCADRNPFREWALWPPPTTESVSAVFDKWTDALHTHTQVPTMIDVPSSVAGRPGTVCNDGDGLAGLTTIIFLYDNKRRRTWQSVDFFILPFLPSLHLPVLVYTTRLNRFNYFFFFLLIAWPQIPRVSTRPNPRPVVNTYTGRVRGRQTKIARAESKTWSIGA